MTERGTREGIDVNAEVCHGVAVDVPETDFGNMPKVIEEMKNDS